MDNGGDEEEKVDDDNDNKEEANNNTTRNLKTNNLEDFKEVLDLFLCKVPDEPKCDGLNPGATNTMTGRQSNSIIHQVARRTEAWMESNQELNPITGLFSNLL